MRPEIKLAEWKCRRCGNTYQTKMEKGEELKKPSFCNCKYRDFELVLEKCEFYDEPKPKEKESDKIGYETNVFAGKKEYVEYNLNQGIFKDHFYYGKLVEIDKHSIESVVFDDGSTATNWEKYLVEKPTVDKKGKTKYKPAPYGSNQIKEMGLTYKHGIIPQKNCWSNKGIDSFIKFKCSSVVSEGVPHAGVENAEYTTQGDSTSNNNNNNKKLWLYQLPLISPTLTTLNTLGKNLLQEIILTLDKFMDVIDRQSLLLVASFILSTYCYSIFDSVGYLFFNSDKESGKTKFAMLVSLMSFHSINCGSPSEPALFRITSLGGGMMVVDDFENIEKDRKNALLQILKVGYRKEGTVIRVEKKNNMFIPVLFDCYCPKIITNTTSLEPVTLSRCIPIHLMKTLTNKGKLWPKEKASNWQGIRDVCHLWVMLNWRKIRETYDSYESEELNNRDLELVKGPLSITKTIDGTLHDQLLSYTVKCFKDRESVDMTGTWGYALFSKLLELASGEGGWLKTSDITELLRQQMVSDAGCGDEKEFRAKKGANLPGTRWVGSTLSKIPSFKKRRVGAGVEYFISKKLVEDYMKIKGFYNASP